MYEHQLILRMIAQMRETAESLSQGAALDPHFVEVAVDFIRSYADRCHHGKEEQILFRELGARDMSDEDAQAMQRLVDDHVWARGKTRELVEASDAYFGGDEAQLPRVAALLSELAGFYPEHIDREDRQFFRKAVTYLTAGERAAMDAECREFDRHLIHERYASIVEQTEAAHGR